MNDAVLSRLVASLDAVMANDRGADLGADLEVAALRLRCLTQRLGAVAEESPYLAFLRRTIERASLAPVATGLAASA